MASRQVILYIAMSLDGFIAKENDDISFLSVVESPGEDYGYNDFIQSVDTVIIGRKTYDKVLTFGIDFSHLERKCYVLSRNKTGKDKLLPDKVHLRYFPVFDLFHLSKKVK